MDTEERNEVIGGFERVVNMTPKELERWLESDESKSVGESENGESKGRKSAKRILEIKAKKRGDLNEDDLEHMRRVRGYVNRHLSQRPRKEGIETSRWRYSLMNWGHDPLK
jgi:hypothetical protein